jgi:type VI secretion system protein ImpC
VGLLRHIVSGEVHPLRPRCRVGRVPTSDLRLDDARVSSEHAVLHHNGSRWEIRDLGSTNGTWVNRQRLPKGERALLSAGAFLMFGGRDLTFELVDASPPIASARQIQTGELRHATSGLLVLPNEEHPVASVFERLDGAWILESQHEQRSVADRDVVIVDGEGWSLELPDASAATLDTSRLGPYVEAATLRFTLSLDEEHVHVTLVHDGGEINMGTRQYHLPLLILARAWIRDAGVPPEERGWVERDEICRGLKVDANKLNVDIYRARKQMIAAGVLGAANLVMRRVDTGHLRLGVHAVEVHKAGAPEAMPPSSPPPVDNALAPRAKSPPPGRPIVLSSAPMAENKKGWIKGNMSFQVGEEPDVDERAPLLPLRIVVVADLTPGDDHNAGASAPEGAVKVDPTDFDDLFQRVRPRISVDVPSVLAEGRSLRVELSPTSFKSFRPDGLCAEVPLLRSLLDGRLVLERLREATVTRDQALSELQRLWPGSPFCREILGLVPSGGAAGAAAAAAPAPAPAPAASSAIDSILDMVDVGGSAPSAPISLEPGVPAAPPVRDEPPTRFQELISAVAKSARPGAGGQVRPTEAISRVERAIAMQIGAILQHPEVRRLEEAWRGLKFLADRTQNIPGVRVDVVAARPQKAAVALERAIKANASAEPPVSIALVDIDIDNTVASLDRAHAIAVVADNYSVPVILGAKAALLGTGDLGEVERLDYKQKLFDDKASLAWRSTVYKPEMRWVVFAANDFLARPPYDKTTSRVREAIVTELPNDEGGFVWMSPIYALGALAAVSFKETGWACRIVGPRAGTLGNLPVHQEMNIDESAEGVAIPTRSYLSTETQKDLGKMGVLALAAAPNSDAVQIFAAPTAYVTPPKRTYDSATTEPEVRLDRVSLVDQLFVARVAQFLRAFCSKLPANAPPNEVAPVLEGALGALFEGAQASSVEIAVKAASHEEHGTSVTVTVRPRRFLGVALEELSMEVPLG